MENFLAKAIAVPFASLFLDPNNPRLAREDHPGYENPKKLFDAKLQQELEQVVRDAHETESLESAIITQGWIPIDAIVVWEFPGDGHKYLVMEGNRRVVALRRLRNAIMQRETQKLESMKRRGATAKHDLEAQKTRVERIQRVIDDTESISVVPLDAKNVAELKQKLPRVLAVRHIQGARPWGSYAEDLWLLGRYQRLFEEKYRGEDLKWDTTLLERVAQEASLGDTKTKRKLQAAAAFSHFRSEFADQLPNGEDFLPTDYYLFENIVKKPWLREQFGLSQEAFHLEREDVLFAWIFAKPRGRNADDNPNVFFRLENVLVWEQMHRYDSEHGTSFASRFDVEDPDAAPTMKDVEAEYLTHKAKRAPTAVLEQLLQQIGGLTQETLVTQADFLRPKLETAIKRCQQCVAMIDAANNVTAPVASMTSPQTTRERTGDRGKRGARG